METSVAGTTSVTGLFGYPVQHSLSPGMHNAAFRKLGLDYVYVPFNVHPDNLETAVRAIRSLGLVGVNLTIPHKEGVIPFLDWISEDALRIRSVNTIHNFDGTLKGYTTDGSGFIKALEAAGKPPKGSKAVVLGAGGSARATVYTLALEGADVTVANRTYSRAVELSRLIDAALGSDAVRFAALDSPEAREAIREADLLVNCTSVGMYPHAEEQPVPAEWLHAGLFVYDQVYNPVETRLLESARAVGARGANGVGMLVFQGALSFEIWTGRTPPLEVMEQAVLEGLAARR